MDNRRNHDNLSPASRKRATRKDLPLYQPGRGLGRKPDGSETPTNPAAPPSRTDNMDAVHKKLEELSLKGIPPPNMMFGGGRAGGGGNRPRSRNKGRERDGRDRRNDGGGRGGDGRNHDRGGGGDYIGGGDRGGGWRNNDRNQNNHHNNDRGGGYHSNGGGGGYHSNGGGGGGMNHHVNNGSNNQHSSNNHHGGNNREWRDRERGGGGGGGGDRGGGGGGRRWNDGGGGGDKRLWRDGGDNNIQRRQNRANDGGGRGGGGGGGGGHRGWDNRGGDGGRQDRGGGGDRRSSRMSSLGGSVASLDSRELCNGAAGVPLRASQQSLTLPSDNNLSSWRHNQDQHDQSFGRSMSITDNMSECDIEVGNITSRRDSDVSKIEGVSEAATGDSVPGSPVSRSRIDWSECPTPPEREDAPPSTELDASLLYENTYSSMNSALNHQSLPVSSGPPSRAGSHYEPRVYPMRFRKDSETSMRSERSHWSTKSFDSKASASRRNINENWRSRDRESPQPLSRTHDRFAHSGGGNNDRRNNRSPRNECDVNRGSRGMGGNSGGGGSGGGNGPSRFSQQVRDVPPRFQRQKKTLDQQRHDRDHTTQKDVEPGEAKGRSKGKNEKKERDSKQRPQNQSGGIKSDSRSEKGVIKVSNASVMSSPKKEQRNRKVKANVQVQVREEPQPSAGAVSNVVEDIPCSSSTSVSQSSLSVKSSLTRQMKDIVEKNVQAASAIEQELSVCVKIDYTQLKCARSDALRKELMKKYEIVILSDPRFCAECNIEQQLWKSVFHQPIELLRRSRDLQLVENSAFVDKICKLTDEGIEFYQQLLSKMEDTFSFKLEVLFPLPSPVISLPAEVSGPLKAVLISCQKILISLGDLSRYRETSTGNGNFNTARDYYLRAQQLAPKNGRPYNQLAILAVYARRKLDAVYYYMRSLAASNAINTAKEALVSLFDDVRKKYEADEKKRRELQQGPGGVKRAKTDSLSLLLPEQERSEVWIREDGSSCRRNTSTRSGKFAIPLGFEAEVESMSEADLNRSFIQSFLHVHGKLFTKVGMEVFPEVASRMLFELKVLLQKYPTSISALKHLQIFCINMFSVANTVLKNTSIMDSNARSVMQEHSVHIALAYITLVIEACTDLLDQSSSSASATQTFESVEHLLPVIKVFTDWMAGHKSLWEPPPTPIEYNASSRGDVWDALAQLLNRFVRLKMDDGPSFTTTPSGKESQIVILFEDTTLAGFVPLLGCPTDLFYSAPTSDVNNLRNLLRINRIHYFGDYLCGLPSPYLAYDTSNRLYFSLVNEGQDDDSASLTPDTAPQSASEDELDNIADFENDDTSHDGDEIEQLRRKKHHLHKKMKNFSKAREYVERVVHQHKSGGTILEIRPKFLIADTNCFIDHLELLQRLVASSRYYLYIPIIVINELDGLARGTRSCFRLHQIPDHAARVTAFAKDALDWLTSAFASKDGRLKSITSKGNLLDSIAFRSENSADASGTNDDMILACCLSLCKDWDRRSSSDADSDSKLKLFREVVLITEDKNLAVKALAHNVPVRDLPNFIEWAAIP